MTRRRNRKPAIYQVFLEPQVYAQRRELPGSVRQRIKRTIGSLAADPRPPHSRALDLFKLGEQAAVPEGVEVRRL